MSALHLQSLFADDSNDQTVSLRYGIASTGAARRVDQDVLDLLLAAETVRPEYSLLSEFALHLEMRLDAPPAVAIIPR